MSSFPTCNVLTVWVLVCGINFLCVLKTFPFKSQIFLIFYFFLNQFPLPLGWSTKCNEIVIKTKVELRGREHLQENPMSHSAHDNKFISLSLCFSGFYFFPYTATTPVSVRYDGMLYVCLCFLVSCNKFHLIFAHKIRMILACTEFFFPLVRI